MQRGWRMGMRRTVAVIDERLCTGCGLCMLDCPTFALEVCDGCSRLADDRCCDGGGACIAVLPARGDRPRRARGPAVRPGTPPGMTAIGAVISAQADI